MLCTQDVLVHKMCVFPCYIFGFSYYGDNKTQVASFSKNKAIKKTVFSHSPQKILIIRGHLGVFQPTGIKDNDEKIKS